jgi:hypothetical protein
MSKKASDRCASGEREQSLGPDESQSGPAPSGRMMPAGLPLRPRRVRLVARGDARLDLLLPPGEALREGPHPGGLPVAQVVLLPDVLAQVVQLLVIN